MVMGADGAMTNVITATASTAETLHTWSVSDDPAALFKISNGTSTDAGFIPTLTGISAGASYGLYVNAQAASDTGDIPLLSFNARIGSASSVATRPLFSWQNNGAELVRINAIGQFIVGYINTAGTTTFNAGDAVFTRASDSVASGSITFEKSRGTVASPTAVLSGDEAGYIYFRGYDGSAYLPAALILSRIDGTPGSSDMPGRLQFYTTPDGSSSVTEALRISSRRNTLINLGAIAEPSTSVGTLVLTNTATAPTTSVDVVSLFSADVAGAGTASLALYTEQAVAIDVIAASTHTLSVNLNGTIYKVLLST
jgi:hypothetical protein